MRKRATMVAMNLAVRKPMSLAEFLEWEDRQELRYEFDGVEPSAMTGGTARHATIQRNFAVAIGNRLRGKPCQFLRQRSQDPRRRRTAVVTRTEWCVCSACRSDRQGRS